MRLVLTLTLAGCVATAVARAAHAQGSADTIRPAAVVGRIDSLVGSRLVLRTRTGARVSVDGLPAMSGARSAVLFVGRVVGVEGTRDAAGVLHAATIVRAKDSPALWPPDR